VLPLPGREREPHRLEARRRPRRRARFDRLSPRAQPSRHRRVPGQVQALLHRHDRRQRHLVDVPPAGDVLFASQPSVLDRDRLQPDDARPAERVRDAEPDLEVPGVGRLVAEDDQVELAAGGALGLDRLEDRLRDRLRVPFLAAGHEVDPAVDPDRHRVAQLLLRLGRPERQHGRLAAVPLDQAHGLLGAALLVRADGEAEVARVDRALVGRQHDLAAGCGHALHAHEHVHDRILAFSGSKSGVAPATATVTG
jgi:hypothetical protein